MNALPAMTDGDRKRVAYARTNGYQVMYAQVSGGAYEGWLDVEEGRKFYGPFYTLEGLQGFAKQHKFAIVYINY